MVVRRVPVRQMSARDFIHKDEYAQPVNPNGGQVLHVELDQRTTEAVADVSHALVLELLLKLARKLVRLVLETAADGVHTNTDDSLKRCQYHLREFALV